MTLVERLLFHYPRVGCCDIYLEGGALELVGKRESKKGNSGHGEEKTKKRHALVM